MRIVFGSDHIGQPLKDVLRDYLTSRGIESADLGTKSGEVVDYPDIAEQVAVRVASGEFDRGVLVCGTGIGMSIAANKVPGIRAALAHDIYSAERAAKSNNAQILTMGAQVIGPEAAKMLVDAWLASSFQGGRSLQKVEKIRKLDEKYHR